MRNSFTKSLALLLATSSALWACPPGGTTTVTVTREQPAFHGFYLGAFAGVGQRNIQGDYDRSEVQKMGTSYSTSPANRHRERGPIVGAFFGYGQTHNCAYIGAEWGVQFEDLNGGHTRNSMSYSHPGPFGGATYDYKGTHKLKYKRGTVAYHAFRFGYTPAADKLIYLKLGLELSRDKITSQGEWIQTAPGTGKKSFYESSPGHTKVTFVPGLGFEKALGKLRLRFEYTYNLGSSITHEETKVKYDQHALKMGMAYQF